MSDNDKQFDPEEIYIDVTITKEESIIHYQKFFDNGITGKFKIKLEKIDELQ